MFDHMEKPFLSENIYTGRSTPVRSLENIQSMPIRYVHIFNLLQQARTGAQLASINESALNNAIAVPSIPRRTAFASSSQKFMVRVD